MLTTPGASAHRRRHRLKLQLAHSPSADDALALPAQYRRRFCDLRHRRFDHCPIPVAAQHRCQTRCAICASGRAPHNWRSASRKASAWISTPARSRNGATDCARAIPAGAAAADGQAFADRFATILIGQRIEQFRRFGELSGGLRQGFRRIRKSAGSAPASRHAATHCASVADRALLSSSTHANPASAARAAISCARRRQQRPQQLEPAFRRQRPRLGHRRQAFHAGAAQAVAAARFRPDRRGDAPAQKIGIELAINAITRRARRRFQAFAGKRMHRPDANPSGTARPASARNAGPGIGLRRQAMMHMHGSEREVRPVERAGSASTCSRTLESRPPE
jgi:hypothetical protein